VYNFHDSVQQLAASITFDGHRIPVKALRNRIRETHVWQHAACTTSEAGRWRKHIKSRRQCEWDSHDWSRKTRSSVSAIHWMQSATWKSMIRSCPHRHVRGGPKFKSSPIDHRRTSVENVCCLIQPIVATGHNPPRMNHSLSHCCSGRRVLLLPQLSARL